MPKVVHEGWMVRYGRNKIGRSFIHMRYFVLENRLIAYYKKRPQDNTDPIKTLLIDGNCRVEDRGLKTFQGHMIYVISVYNRKKKDDSILMAGFNIQETLIWKEKIESVIDQHQESQDQSRNKYVSFEYKSGQDNARRSSSSDHESQFSEAEDEDDPHPNLLRRTAAGNGKPESVLDWTEELGSDCTNQNSSNQARFRHWRLLQCQNGLRIFEELLEVNFLPKSCSRALKAVGVVGATCEEIFELVMSMDASRFEWDCTFQYGSLIEEIDGHTAMLYHRLQLDWFPKLVWPRDLCYVRYWRRNDDGSYVVLLRSREHENCGPQPGFVRARIESGGFEISPLAPSNGRPRSQVQYLMQIDLNGWGVNYSSSFQQHCVLQMLNSVAGLRDYCSQMRGKQLSARSIPVMVNMKATSASSDRSLLSPLKSADRNAVMIDEYSDEDEDYQLPDQEVPQSAADKEVKRTAPDEEPEERIDSTIFSGNLQRDDNDEARNCWTISDGNNFRVRSKNFFYDKSKSPGGKHLMEIVAVDWLRDTKKMNHVARRSGSAAQIATDKGLFSLVINLQVPGSTHYSMVFYFVTKKLVPGSLLHRFVHGDDQFRNSRLTLIPSVRKGSWIVRQSVGSNPCLLGKVVDCNYIRGAKYLEIDVDIASSAVANGVLRLVTGLSRSLVVDMAFLVQANTEDELPEQLIGAVRVSYLELSSAVVPESNRSYSYW